MTISKEGLRALYTAYERQAEDDAKLIEKLRAAASRDSPSAFLSPRKLEGRKGVSIPYRSLGRNPQSLVEAYASMGITGVIDRDNKVMTFSPDDLKKLVRHLGKRRHRFDDSRQGIPFHQLLRASTAKDKERAKDVRSVVFYGRKGNILYFQVSGNARPHYRVQIRLEDWDKAVSTATPALRAIQQVLSGGVSIECPCGRHQFWYRYLATIGNYAIEPKERDFPKIRNPTLTGCCCKHVLKVLQTIKGTRVTFLLARELDRERARPGFLTSSRKNVLSAQGLRLAEGKRMTRTAMQAFRQYEKELRELDEKQKPRKARAGKTAAKYTVSPALVRSLGDVLSLFRSLGMNSQEALERFAAKHNLSRETVDAIIKDNNL